MMHSIDVKDMSALQVLRLMKNLSGKTLEDIAEELERDTHTVGNYLSEGAKQFPPVHIVPKLCAVLGSDLMLQWMQARYEQHMNGGPTPPPAPIGRTEALEQGHLLQKSLAAIMESIFECGDLRGEIVASDASQVAGKVDRLINDLVELRRRMQACRQDSYDHAKYKPLFRRSAPANDTENDGNE